MPEECSVVVDEKLFVEITVAEECAWRYDVHETRSRLCKWRSQTQCITTKNRLLIGRKGGIVFRGARKKACMSNCLCPTYRRSDRKDESGPVFKIGAEENVGDVRHKQENGAESGSRSCKLRDHDGDDVCDLAKALVNTKTLENLAGRGQMSKKGSDLTVVKMKKTSVVKMKKTCCVSFAGVARE